MPKSAAMPRGAAVPKSRAASKRAAASGGAPRRAGAPPKRRTKGSAKRRYSAATADIHELYQLSVQGAAHEVDFMERVYRRRNRRRPSTLREDFCGTALLCAEWASRGADRRATGVDISAETLAWGREHNLEPLGAAAERVTLLCEDVRKKRAGRFDVVNALNFSYWVFDDRETLRNYFAAVRASLAPGGIFLLDAYGGWEAQQPMEEPRRIAAGFTYVWEQHSFDPITSRVVNFIHFRFADGTGLERAFRYEWRAWTLPELRELLLEAGFDDVTVYWDRSDDDDVENYRPSVRAENQPGWLAYLVAGRAGP
jgi:SAM-dependent methyltransferase